MTEISPQIVQIFLLLIAVLSLGIAAYSWFKAKGLRFSEDQSQKYRNLFDQAGDGIIVHDADGKILDVNHAICDLFGYSMDEFCQLTVPQLHPSDIAVVEKSREAFALVARDGQVRFENDFITRDGEILIGDVTAKVIHDSGGKYIHAVFRNVTVQKQMEAALKKQNQQYLSLLENVNVISWELDLSNTNFIYVSPNAERILGYPMKDWVNMDSWVSMVLVEDREFARKYCTAEALAGRDHTFEYRMQKQNGEIIWILEVVRVIKDQTDNPVRLAGFMFDNTDQHELTAKLDESRRAYRNAQEIAQLGYWQMDIKTGKITWSDDIFRMLGMAPETELGVEFLANIVHPDDWPKVESSLKTAIREGTVHEMEYRVSCPGRHNEILWVYSKAERLRDSSGQAKSLSGIVQDITERKQNELALRESESFLNDIFDAIQNGISILDTDFNIVKTNRWLDEYYTDKKPLIGKKCYHVYQDSDAVCDFCPTKDVLETGLPKTDTLKVPLAGGGTGWVELSVFPVKNEAGRIVNVIEYIKDITKRKTAESRLARFRNLLEQSSDVILIINADTSRIVDANMAACKSLGYDLDKLLTLHVWEIDSNMADQEAWHAWVDSLAKQTDVVSESRYLRNNGDRFPVEVNTRHVETEDEDLIIAIARDLSDIVRIHDQLVESESKLRTILDNVDAFIYLKDLDGKYLFANKAVRDLWHADMDDILGYGDEKFFDEASSQAIRINDSKVLNEGMILRAHETNTVPQTGKTAVYQSTKLPLRHEDGEIYALCGISMDVTEQKKAETDLKESERRFKIAGQAAYDLIYEWDVASDELKWYSDIDRILGYAEGQISQNIRAWLDLIHPDDLQFMQDSVELHRTSSSDIQYEYRVRHADGSYRYWSDHALPMLDKDNKPYRWVGVCADITLLKEHQLQLEHNANHDLLTGLPNRVLLSDRLKQAMLQEKRFKQKLAVVYIDLDGFKQINDRYGHDVGDQVLIGMANRFSTSLREGDTISRFGGDEFVAVLSGVGGKESCVPLLKRLLQASTQPIQESGEYIQLSASLGISLYPQEEDVDGDQLLRQADQAMYQAKLAGKNRYSFFDTEYDRTLRGKKEDVQRIEKGLLASEFELYYQPKVNMSDGKVVGVEALLRWRHPQQGLLLPAHFLPVIEDHAVAVDLGEWVLDSALSQLAEWESQGLFTAVSVNIGAQQLQTTDFVRRLKEIMQRYPEIEPTRLQLEILETSALNDISHITKIMQECLEFGVSFALDDFGTGYSSLSYLKHLPATSIKIDRSFVRDMLHDPDDLAILEGILGMATAFRRNIIAEGVESAEHGELLLKLGCKYAQGYGIAKPMPPHEFPEWLSKWSPFESWQHQRRVSRDDLSLLFAGIEHRAWVNGVEGSILNKVSNFPVLDHTKCRFAAWLSGDGYTNYSHLDAYQEIVMLHEHIHVFVKTLAHKCRQGEYEQAADGLPELRRQAQFLLSLLDGLVGSASQQ
ncbi:MAG: PAS domain S-box protein [Candidatus Thiodiazotropha sp.]